MTTDPLAVIISLLRPQAVVSKLISGAGHDGVVMAALTPIAMLFVRCRGGLSHHPDEYASPKDLDVALRVVVDFLQKLGEPKK